MTNTRLPTDYKLQESAWSNNYLRITEDPQEFRILDHPIIGYEYFKVDGDRSVPVRQKEPFTETPDAREDSKPKEFRAFPIWNHTLGKVQIMEITQQSIKKEILKYVQDADNRGDPKKYDLRISRTGKWKETRYSVTALPKSKFESANDEKAAFELAKPINLEALYSGDDPFKPF